MIDSLPEKIASLVEPVARAHGLDLVDVEYHPHGRRSILRLVLDREGGITLDSLADVSREVSDLLDAHDIVPGGYTLECSSPGVNRPLKTRSDFARFCGKSVRVRTRAPIDGTRSFAGRLVETFEDCIEIEDRSRGRLSVPYPLIEKAHYEHDFADDFRGRRD
jgi:ribosome maturation factor RimP